MVTSMEFEKNGVCEQFGEIMQRLVQIEGIPSVAVWFGKIRIIIMPDICMFFLMIKTLKSGYVLTDSW
mgnify:CR=1 FL=1